MQDCKVTFQTNFIYEMMVPIIIIEVFVKKYIHDMSFGVFCISYIYYAHTMRKKVYHRPERTNHSS
jgi:hypothetical protein